MRAVLTNPFLWLAVGGWVFSSAIQALPEPSLSSDGIQPFQSKAWYFFVYKWLHALGANWKQYNLAAWLLKLCGK